MKIFLFVITLVSNLGLMAQKADRGFKNLEKNDFIKAGELFSKILSEDSTNCAAQFGISLVLSHENNPNADYFAAWDHFVVANKYFSKLTEDDNTSLKEFFTLRDAERRNKTIRFNFDIEEKIIEDKLIKYVREENNLEIAEKFIQVYPNSRFYENVVHIRNHIEYRIAEKTNTLQAYTDFLKKYPNAAQKDEAIKARNELAFQMAKKTNTIEAMEIFLQSYPEAYHYYDALKLRDQLAFEDAKKLNTIEGFDRFIALYSNSLQIPQAKVIQRKLLYEKARQVNTLDAYNEFISRYPDGEFFVDIFNLKTSVLGRKLIADVQGNKEMIKWVKGFDFEQRNDSAGGISLTSDNKIILSGTRNRSDSTGTEAWVICVDSEGKSIWNKSFGNMPVNKVKFQVVAPNGDIIVGGSNGANTDSLSRKGWIFAVSNSGSGKWERNIDGKEISAISIATNGDIYASGYYSTDSISEALFLVKMNNKYQNLWSREYIRTGNINSFAITPSQNLVIGAGRWLWKTDPSGYIVWEKMLPVTDSLIACNLSPGGIFYLTGSRNNSPYLARINDQGAISWEKNLPDMPGFVFDYATVLPDNNLLTRIQGNGTVGFMVLSSKGEIVKEIRFIESQSQIFSSVAINATGEIFIVFTKNNFSNSEIIVCKLITK